MSLGKRNRNYRYVALLFLAAFVSSCAPGGSFLTGTDESETRLNAPTPNGTGESEPRPTPTPLPQSLAARRDGQRALFYGDWERAIRHYQTALAQATDAESASAALLGLGEARLRSGDATGAIVEFTTLTQTYPEAVRAADAHFWLGEAHRRQGAWDAAVQEYRAYLALRPGAIDSYVYQRIADAQGYNGDSTAAIESLSKAIAAPRAGSTVGLRTILAQLYADASQHDAALAQYDTALQETTLNWQKSRLEFLAGQALEELGATEAAHLRYNTIVTQYPETAEALDALARLDAAGLATDDYQRGLVYYFAGRYAGAAAAFADDLATRPDHGAALYFTALSQRALGDAAAAVATLEDLIARLPADDYWDDAWFELAWTHREYLDSFEDAIAAYRRFVEAAPDHPRAPEALFLAARLAERLGDLPLATQLWRSIPENYPNADNAPEAAFQAGIVLYRADDFSTAAQTFAAIPTMPQANAERRAAALLWLGKSRARLGDSAGRDAAWAEAAAADPHGYYSIRAAELAAGQMTPFTPPANGYELTFNETAERAEAEAWLASQLQIADDGHLGDLSPNIVSDGRWARGLELWRLGLYDEARAEFESLRGSYEADALALYQLGLAFREIGLYRSSATAIRQCLDRLVSNRLDVPRYLIRLRFSPYYADLVVPIANQYGLDPLFLFSVIRQESAFEPFAGSSAGAHGLMQIIPSTAAEIADRLGWPNYRESDLGRPIVSLNFGAYYLSQKLAEYNGDRFAALAAYNAGSGNAAAWKQIAPDDPDLYLEVIRIQETENYLRFIYEIYDIYKTLYGK